MSERKCSCAALERLEGASVTAYICAYLEQASGQQPDKKNRYRCRACGIEWEKRWPETKRAGTRPSLVRQK
jgi:hypothetical protein